MPYYCDFVAIEQDIQIDQEKQANLPDLHRISNGVRSGSSTVHRALFILRSTTGAPYM